MAGDRAPISASMQRILKLIQGLITQEEHQAEVMVAGQPWASVSEPRGHTSQLKYSCPTLNWRVSTALQAAQSRELLKMVATIDSCATAKHMSFLFESERNWLVVLWYVPAHIRHCFQKRGACSPQPQGMLKGPMETVHPPWYLLCHLPGLPRADTSFPHRIFLYCPHESWRSPSTDQRQAKTNPSSRK